MSGVRGQGAYQLFGEETVYGTSVVRTITLLGTGGGLKREITIEDTPHLGLPGGGVAMAHEHYPASDVCSGSLEYPLTYDGGVLMLLKAAMGSVASAGGAAPYVHTFTPDADVSFLTIEQVYGTHSSLPLGEVFVSASLSGFELSFEVGKPVMISFPDMLAQTSGGMVAAGAATVEVAAVAYHQHAGTLTLGAVSVTLDKIKIKFDRKLKGYQQLGSLNVSEPCADDFAIVEFEFDTSYDTNTLYAMYLASGTGDAQITLTGSGTDEIVIDLKNAFIVSMDKPADKPGRLVQSIKCRAQPDTSNEAITVTVTNSNASIWA